MLFVVWGIVAKWGSRWAHNPKVRGSKPRYALISFFQKSLTRPGFEPELSVPQTDVLPLYHRVMRTRRRDNSTVLHHCALPIPPVIDPSHFNPFIAKKRGHFRFRGLGRVF